MRSKGFEGMTCSIADVLGALGDRWGTLIIRDLMLGLSRYDDLRQSTGVTNTMLSDRLKLLEQNGLVERRLYQSRPDRYEYLLTPKGKDIGLVLQAMVQVGDKWNIAGLNGPPLQFIDTRSGHAVKLALVDAETGTAVRSQDIGVKEGPGADDLVRWRLSKSHNQAGSEKDPQSNGTKLS